jgi:hypothetical protein
MNIQEFAQQHNLRVVKDGCDDPMILGRIYQSNIYEYSDSELGVMFITDGQGAPRTGLWKKFQAAGLAVGMIPRQLGDAEGAFSFDPTNKEQSEAAIKGIRARVKRQVSEEQRAVLATRLARARQARSL